MYFGLDLTWAWINGFKVQTDASFTFFNHKVCNSTHTRTRTDEFLLLIGILKYCWCSPGGRADLLYPGKGVVTDPESVLRILAMRHHARTQDHTYRKSLQRQFIHQHVIMMWDHRHEGTPHRNLSNLSAGLILGLWTCEDALLKHVQWVDRLTSSSPQHVLPADEELLIQHKPD